jgi:hypothetical protein
VKSVATTINMVRSVKNKIMRWIIVLFIFLLTSCFEAIALTSFNNGSSYSSPPAPPPPFRIYDAGLNE